MTSNHRNKLIALICTLVFHVMLVVLLLSLYLRYNGVEDNERTWPLLILPRFCLAVNM